MGQLAFFVADFWLWRWKPGPRQRFVADQVLVYSETGNGGFSAAVYSPLEGEFIVAEGDFNGDGRADLVVTSSEGITLLLSTGDGTFTTTPSVLSIGMQAPGGPPPCCIDAVAAADFNGDGNLDLAARLSSHSLVVLLGRGDGSFESPIVVPQAPSFFENQLLVADVNGDSIPDLIASGEGVDYFLGTGTGSFQPKVPLAGYIPLGLGVSYLTLADFNGDGKIDIAFVGGGEGQAAVATFLNTSPQPAPTQ